MKRLPRRRVRARSQINASTPRPRNASRVPPHTCTSSHLCAMAAPVVYSDVAPGADLHGQLFAGKKFWVAQRVFYRSRYLDLIRSNGGEVVLLEKKADYLIADHARNDCPPGSISYTFIDDSIEEGELQDPERHRAGPSEGTARAPGSLSTPARTTRAGYTTEEDRILYKWVHDSEKAGGLTSGNEIYKKLEKKVGSGTSLADAC